MLLHSIAVHRLPCRFSSRLPAVCSPVASIVAVEADIELILSAVFFFAFGLAFEVPVATVLIVWTGLTTPEKLGKARPYVFLGAFVMGMFLTPPDVISQTLLAVPVYLLYELGIIMSRMFAIREEVAEEEEPTAD